MFKVGDLVEDINELNRCKGTIISIDLNCAYPIKVKYFEPDIYGFKEWDYTFEQLLLVKK